MLRALGGAAYAMVLFAFSEAVCETFEVTSLLGRLALFLLLNGLILEFVKEYKR